MSNLNRDLRVALFGAATVFFFQWVFGVPAVWAPDAQAKIVGCLIVILWIIARRSPSSNSDEDGR